MVKFVFIVICLYFQLCFAPLFRPISEKNLDFVDDVCYYKDYSQENNFIYVKPCDNGKHCVNIDNSEYQISVCQNYSNIAKTYGKPCNYKIECKNDLVCNDYICSLENNTYPYSKSDLVSYDTFYYCPSINRITIRNMSSYANHYNECKSKYTLENNKYYYQTRYGEHEYYLYVYPEYFQVQGIIELDEYYKKKSIDLAYIGSVNNGNFVADPRACKSGYALYFYGSGMLEKSEDSFYNNEMFLCCVTIEEIDVSEGTLKYIIREGYESEIYNINKLDSSYRNQFSNHKYLQLNKYLMTKLDMFQNYINYIKSYECTEYYDEPFTCGNDLLRKWWYFYHYPEKYLLYKKDGEVLDYLVQQVYKTYAYRSESTNKKKENEYNEYNNYIKIKIKYFVYLLLLFYV